jgi:hypothetical protein
MAAFFVCGGFSIESMPAPKGFDHVDDPAWSLLAGTKFTLDEAKGLYDAAFTPQVKQLAGRDFTIAGYMMPLSAGLETNHFAILRRSPGCPFCPPNQMGEAVEVTAKKPIRYTQDLVTVEGVLQLESTSSEGLFFRLSEAKTS